MIDIKTKDRKNRLGKQVYRSIKLLGVECNVLTDDDIMDLARRAIDENEKKIIANHNLHSIYLYHHNPKMQKFFNRADYIHIDGMPVVFWGKILGLDVERKHRTTSIDWIDKLMKLVRENGYKLFFLGSKPGIGEKAASFLQAKFPGIEIITHHGYFDPAKESAENQAVLEHIKAVKPDILMAGMGMPRQEIWILENIADLDVNAILPVGALMDYISGIVPTPPRWLGQAGLEWLYRLIQNPKKFAGRYFIEPWNLMPYVFRDVARKMG